MIRNISEEQPVVGEIFPTHVEFSTGNGMCYVYFSGLKGKESFDKALEVLKLYKPSIRKALASLRHARYTPDIKFVYDRSIDHGLKITEILDNLNKENQK